MKRVSLYFLVAHPTIIRILWIIMVVAAVLHGWYSFYALFFFTEAGYERLVFNFQNRHKRIAKLERELEELDELNELHSLPTPFPEVSDNQPEQWIIKNVAGKDYRFDGWLIGSEKGETGNVIELYESTKGAFLLHYYTLSSKGRKVYDWRTDKGQGELISVRLYSNLADTRKGIQESLEGQNKDVLVPILLKDKRFHDILYEEV